METALMGWGGMLMAIFFVILAIAWIVMPFAIIGTKSILRELLEEQQRTRKLLEQLVQAQKQPQAKPAAQLSQPTSEFRG